MRTLAGEDTSFDPVMPSLVSIRHNPTSAAPPGEVVFPSGTVLRLPAEYSPQHLATLVHANVRERLSQGRSEPMRITGAANLHRPLGI